jgi:hypothetical protein
LGAWQGVAGRGRAWQGDAACRGIRIQKQGAGARLSKEALVLSRGAVSCAGGCRDSHSSEARQRGRAAAWRPDGDAGAGAGRCWGVEVVEGLLVVVIGAHCGCNGSDVIHDVCCQAGGSCS